MTDNNKLVFIKEMEECVKNNHPCEVTYDAENVSCSLPSGKTPTNLEEAKSLMLNCSEAYIDNYSKNLTTYYKRLDDGSSVLRFQSIDKNL